MGGQWSAQDTLATASEDGTVRIWTKDGQPIHALFGHTKAVRAVAWSADGTRLASGSDDKTARIWPGASGGRRAPGPGPAVGLRHLTAEERRRASLPIVAQESIADHDTDLTWQLWAKRHSIGLFKPTEHGT
jgi:WD40 repeat protein